MAFCEFSSEVVSKNFITLDNLFVSDFMPNANDNCVKVYLYGLYLCSTSRDNNIESFSKVLNLSVEDIVSIYYYWQEEGLVQVLNIDPIQVRYLPIKNAVSKIKKYNVDNCFVIGHIGRYSEQKNHLFILKVFKEILKRRSNSSLTH